MVSTVTPKPEMLRPIHLLKSFTDAELGKLIALGSTQTFEAHSNIVIEGEYSWGLYLILEGRLGIFKKNSLTGDSYDVGQLAAGGFFGEMSLVDENPRSATVKAITDSVLFLIPKDHFMELINKSADLKLRFCWSTISHLVSRLRELNENYITSQYQLWTKIFKNEQMK